MMGLLFYVESNTITYHLGEVYKSGELEQISTTRKIRVVKQEGTRNVHREIDHYNLDAMESYNTILIEQGKPQSESQGRKM